MREGNKRQSYHVGPRRFTIVFNPQEDFDYGMKAILKFWRRAFLVLIVGWAAQVAGSERIRVMVETDAGGDPDDEQSMVRFLLYCNEWDVEGIIANRPSAREGENKNTERTGLGIVRRMVEAYRECYPNLKQHDAWFPPPEYLMERVVPGYADVEDGVNLIIKAVDSNDPRPLWFMNWGTDAGSAPSCLKRALDRVLQERGKEAYAKFKQRIWLSSSEEFEEHTYKLEPAFPFWVDTFRPEIERRRWYHRFSAITAKAGGFDLVRDVVTEHGPLGALYPTNTTHWQKEGDTMSFLYLVPTGMNDPREPGWGSWAGRYGLMDHAGGRRYFWANQVDTYNGTTHRENSLLRWAEHLQNDFRARLDWCVTSKSEANHRPKAVVNGNATEEILRLNQRAGEPVRLSAVGSSDPDGDRIEHRWEIYREAGKYQGEIPLTGAESAEARLEIPETASGEIHVILTLSDDGEPKLVSYRRVILHLGK